MSKNLPWPGPGYWIEVCSLESWQYTDEHFECSTCNKHVENALKYCPHCGERKRAIVRCNIKMMDGAFDD